MPVKSDVIIVGGGVVGAACARELARAGFRPLLIDDGALGGEAWLASAGMLAPQVESSEDDDLLDLGLAGREYFATQADLLKEATGIDIELWQGGILRVAHSTGEAEDLHRQVGWQRQHGHLCDWLAPDEVRKQWPKLVPGEGAFWAPNDGSLNPVALVKALRADAEAHGATLVQDRILRLDLDRQGKVSGVTGTQRYAGDQVIVAAGAWSGRLEGLPRPLSVEPVRGQILATDWPASLAPGIYFGGGVYVVPRGGSMWVGATMEHAGFSATTTDEAKEILLNGLRTLIPSMEKPTVLRHWSGLRPGTPDGLPILGPEPMTPGLWYATGHGRNGILLAGVTGVILQQLLAGEAPFENIDSLRPERFWNW